MRITESQLRKIIRQEARRLRESLDHENLKSIPAGATYATALDETAADWYDRWSPEDPSMAPMGQAGWNAQVDAAIDSLEEAIINAFEEAEAGLMNGDYARFAR